MATFADVKSALRCRRLNWLGIPVVGHSFGLGPAPVGAAGRRPPVTADSWPERGRGGEPASHGVPANFSEAETFINARRSTVWTILTDAGNLTVWESGITNIEGDIFNGATIRVRLHGGDRRSVRLRVQQVPGQVMRWESGLPLGLITCVRTFFLTPRDGMTRLQVIEEVRGPWRRISRNACPASEKALGSFAEAVRTRAELLDRYF